MQRHLLLAIQWEGGYREGLGGRRECKRRLGYWVGGAEERKRLGGSQTP